MNQVHDEMWRVEGELPLAINIFSFAFLIFSKEALTRIIGAYPAFMRPREYRAPFNDIQIQTCFIQLAFGSFNDLVQQASGVRGQSIAIWDFEYVTCSPVSTTCTRS